MNEQKEPEQIVFFGRYIPGVLVLAAYLITQFLRGRWDTFILPVASIRTVLSGPGYYLVTRLHSAPTGLLAVAGSFVMFASGTAAELTKHRCRSL
jgi:hypothetical protein